MSAPRSVALRELLLAIAWGDRADLDMARLLDAVPTSDVVSAARHHRIVSLAHERLRRVDGVDRELVDALAQLRMRAQIACLQLQEAQAAISDALTVPWLTLKGEALAHWYADPSTRDYNDIDVLVRPPDFRAALESLESHGIVPASENWRGFLDYGVAEIPLRRGYAVVDLHWHIVAMAEARRHLGPSTESLFERAVTAVVGGVELTTLDDVDTLLHLCINVGLDGARRLRGLIDIDTVVRSGRVEPVEFAHRVRMARAGRLVSAVLQRSHALLGTPLPDGLLVQLAPGRTWMAVNRIVDRIGGRGWRPEGGVASGLLISSGFESALASMIATTRAGYRALASEAGRVGLTQEGGALDWRRRAAPGRADDDRREYLAWVECQRG